MTEWDRFNAAMKAIMSVPPETAEAIRRRDLEPPVSRPGQSAQPSKSERRRRSDEHD